MLEVSHLSVSYGPHRALEDVSIRVGEGEICVILGANGAGKSSLLKAIAGLVKPLDGSRITVDGADITRLSPDRIVEAGLALVPEGRGIFGAMTVAENLQLGAYSRRARDGEAAHRSQVLALFPRLAERHGQVVRTMSGGEQQMVAIARALMSNPAILMMDEPSLGLSPILTKELFRSLAAVRETGVGILLVEQNARQSLAIADRGYLIENGRIVGEGRAEELARDPAVQAAYLGGASDGGTPAGEHAPKTIAHPPGSAEALAERAAYIHRRHIETVRAGGANGKAVHFHVPPVAANDRDREDIVMDSRARELSAMAGEMAERAADIHRRHVEAQRAAANGAVRMPAAAGAGDLIVAPGATANALVPTGGGKKPKKPRKAKKRAKKLAKQARKLAKEALRLID